MNKFVVIEFLKRISDIEDSLTEQLSQTIIQKLPSCDEAEAIEFADQINALWKHANNLISDNQKLNRATRRVKQIHEAIDEALVAGQKGLQEKISCKKGCSNCCHLNIVVTDDEAEVLAPLYDGTQNEKLKRQAAVTDDLKYPSILGYEDAACVFLKDNACSVYENRPMACRTYYVVSNPEDCDAIKHPDRLVKQASNFVAEMIKSVAYKRAGCDRISRQILKRRADV